MTGNPDYSVIVPVFNNQETIQELYQQLIDVFEQGLKKTFEIVFIDDVSKDQSWSRLRMLQQKDGRITLIKLQQHVGQHQATLLGLIESQGRSAITMDADGQIPPVEIEKLMDDAYDDYEIVIGAYACKQHHRVQNIGSWVIDKLLQVHFRKPSGLTISSFKLFRRSAIENLEPFLWQKGYLAAFILSRFPASALINVSGIQHLSSGQQSSYSWMKRIRLVALLLGQALGLPYKKEPVEYEKLGSGNGLGRSE